MVLAPSKGAVGSGSKQGVGNSAGEETKDGLPSLKRTVRTLKMDGWKMKCPFQMPYFQGIFVSFREGNQACERMDLQKSL